MQTVLTDASKLLESLDRGISLPAYFYTDPALVSLEQERIFRRSWQYMGPLEQLAGVGDFITGYVGDVPIVVVRNDFGLAAFVNACRHRRHEVMKGCGTSKVMQCGYHAWTYDLTGCLKSAPRSEREESFELSDYPLLPVKVDTLGPFVFVNLDADCKPLAHYYGPVLDVIAGSGIDINNLKLFKRAYWNSRANWKTLLENYLECYHCPVAHPGFSSAIDVDPDCYELSSAEWFSSQVGHARPAALEGKTKVKTYDARGEVHQAQYHLLWPNFTININPGFPNLSIDVWLPDGANDAQGFSEQFFGPGVSEEFARELIEFNARVGEEDDELTSSVQRSLIGGQPDRGRFLASSEHLIVHFQKLVVKMLGA
jgi:phenylpropionate dioxygenase-like ring-hydroxylating dioxygenase large terminal subunit